MNVKFYMCVHFVLVLCCCVSCGGGDNVSLDTVLVAEGDVCETVTATGTVECVTTVEVGTQVTGIISKLYADYNSKVNKGELVAELEKTLLESELRSADANLESTRLALEYTMKNFERDKILYDKQLISDYEYETSRKDYLTAKSSYSKAEADRVRAAKNLNYAEIYSPIDGIVISRDVEEGQTVVSSMNVANLFTIADLKNMQVIADVDETDVGMVKVGQNATFTVDAFPDDVFSGVVKQVRLSATVTNNVVTYEVVISVDNSDLKLIPGLTANIEIKVKERRGVAVLPIKALKFIPQKFEGDKVIPCADTLKHNFESGNTVWLVNGSELTPVNVVVGENNGVNFEVLSGVEVGDEVALKYVVSDDREMNSAGSSPFMPRGPKK